MRKTTRLFLTVCCDVTKGGGIMRMKGLKSFVILKIFLIAIVPGVITMPASTSAEGLSASGNQFWHEGKADIQGGAEAGDKFGYALSSGDFNNDGYADLAIGVPWEDVGSINSAGKVTVLYGTAQGLSTSGDQIWTQDSEDISGVAEASDHFGYALTSGDFDNDGYADLAIGVPWESVEGVSDAGAVNVLYGTAEGLSASGNRVWHEDSAGIIGQAYGNDHFGYALSSGDFDNDGYADLAIGVPWEGVGGHSDAGAVNVLYGTAQGLSASRNQRWHEDSTDIIGQAYVSDKFGYALTSGDFDNDGFADLAIGVPWESVEGVSDAGAVNVLYGTAQGLSASNNQRWHQNSPNIKDDAEAGDKFGYALSSGDSNGDGFADLAIGVENEAFISPDRYGTGTVHILTGTAQGLSASLSWMADKQNSGVRFGYVLNFGDFNNDGYADLAIGFKKEDIGSEDFGGAVLVLYAVKDQPRAGAQGWFQDSEGILDEAEEGDDFGYALRSGDFNGDGSGDLAIGVPGEDVEGKIDAGAVNVLYGSRIHMPRIPLPLLLLDD